MKNVKFLLLIVFNFLIVNTGCINKQTTDFTEKYDNGAVKVLKMKINNDSANYRCEEFYINGKLKSTYYMLDTLYNGYNINYYENGRIQSEGNWYLGKKIGYFKYYDSSGKKDKVVEFISFKNADRTNQVIKFTASGDTILNNGSLYYEYYSTGDTIKNGNPYEFRFVLRGHIFNKAHLRICNYDEHYNLASEETCEGLPMENFVAQLIFRKYKIGENVFRGVITNYDSSKTESPNTNKYVEVYFTEKFYVTP